MCRFLPRYMYCVAATQEGEVISMHKCPGCGADGFFDGEIDPDWWQHNEGEPMIFRGVAASSLKPGEDVEPQPMNEFSCPKCNARFPREKFDPVDQER